MDLVIWLEKGLSEVDDAEVRYQKILVNEGPIPFDDLDAKMKDFIEDVAGKLPRSVVGLAKGQGLPDVRFSNLGVIVRFGDDVPENAYEEVLGAATDLDLTTYDPEMGIVMGYDDSVDIEIQND